MAAVWGRAACSPASPPVSPPFSLHRDLCRLLHSLAAPFFEYNPGRDISAHNSRIQELSRLGRVEEARRLFDEMPQRDTFSWNSMISAYLRRGMVEESRALFDVFPGRNVWTWTILMSGYARVGHIDEARRLFDAMPERNAVSWNAMISGYVQNGDIASARRLFERMTERNVITWNSLINGCCRAHLMAQARELFERMPDRDLASWTIMISGYVQIEQFGEACWMFLRMRHGGGVPDQPSFVAVLSAVMGLSDLKLLESLRTLAIKANFEGDVVVGTSILNVYTRCNTALDLASHFFEGMPDRNEYSWSTMISALSQNGRLDDAILVYNKDPQKSIPSRCAMLTGYAQHGKIHEARQFFEQNPDPHVVYWNAMIAGFTQNRMIEEAMDLFDRMPVRNIITWAAMIAGCAQNGKNREALELLSELHRLGMLPSYPCLTSAFFACGNIGMLEMGRQIHTLAVKVGSQFNSYVCNGLITMYARCKNSDDLAQIFNRMSVRDTVSWNSLIAGLSQNDLLEDARNAFERMPHRDVVSWTAIISAYVQAGQGNEALRFFLRMLHEGMKPNPSTITGLLSSCGALGATKLGCQVHCLAGKLGLELNVFVCNALISMYFKCGCVDAFRVFDEMPECDVITWNAVLAGCAQHGFGREAIEFFEQMKSEGVLPDQATFVSVLCACSHAGLVDEGWQYFNSMSRDYNLMPLNGHYACMVDLLGRAGRLYEAENLIDDMPIEPDSVVWGALLSACRIHQNVELGRKVAERLFQMEPENSGNYVLLSNIYASLCMWDEVGKVRKLMKDQGVSKEPGSSWMQVKNRLHSFVTGDIQHEQLEEIHATLKEFYTKLKATGYIPETNYVLHDIEEEQKENVLLHHSEKLAIAFGLLNTPNGTPIQIMKNLRICGDCHNFIKFISKETGREIDVRDGNRFHHFKDGTCSCGDYW
ncbi:hypothetical protein Taro_027233 [Colocasia esculenta]|uniref:DYW domain-containing protein n=1 Tax=Colocasia esculenta TaxID=4460 RepID=A0A843V857_COLES|nr:hypothetical protein [Colocasia esculenta]